MTGTVIDDRNPRKAPQQSRSKTTVATILEATIRILMEDSGGRLNTTRISQRAGVSVGTTYQYFPNKQALLHAVLETHVNKVAEAIEAACANVEGCEAREAAYHVVATFFDAMLLHLPEAKALNATASEKSNGPVMMAFIDRLEAVIARLLTKAPDVHFDNIADVSFTIVHTMTGATRWLFELETSRAGFITMKEQLCLMIGGYISEVSNRA